MKVALRRIAYSHSSLKVPVIDVSKFLSGSPGYQSQCKQVAGALHKFGCLVIKDPRVKQSENDIFLDQMERYFSARGKAYYDGDKTTDIYPNYSYQVGATPQKAQIARLNKSIIDNYSKENAALTPQPPPSDSKWRYFWNIGDSDGQAPNQIPKGYPEFQSIMNNWGNHMIDGCQTVAEMAAIGMGMQRNVFTKLMKGGPHKLAPTASDLTKYEVGTVFAGFHYDFNFLTIHGKSRFPGLFAWLRTGEKFTVSVPEGHLLLQAGKQFQWLTGGYINCGYHQVIYTEKVREAKEAAIKAGKIPWRISSTLFSHIRNDAVLQPLGKFKTEKSLKQYPPIVSSEHTRIQLEEINLSGTA